MCALLYHVAVTHNEYHIGITYGLQTVRHDKAGSPLHKLIEGIADLHLGSCVYRRCRFIEDKDGCRSQHKPAYTDKLALSL